MRLIRLTAIFLIVFFQSVLVLSQPKPNNGRGRGPGGGGGPGGGNGNNPCDRPNPPPSCGNPVPMEGEEYLLLTGLLAGSYIIYREKKKREESRESA